MLLVKINIYYNARIKWIPPVPTLRCEVIFSLIQIAPKTIRDESFLISSNFNSEIIIVVCCITNLKHVCISET